MLVDSLASLTGWRIEARPLPGGSDPDPAWHAWYTFGGESRRSAGRMVRVLAGAGTTTSHAGAGEDLPVGSAQAAGFQPAFAAAGVELPLVDPTGNIIHRQSFLPDTAYTPVSARILRMVDARGPILLSTDGARRGLSQRWVYTGSGGNSGETSRNQSFRRTETGLRKSHIWIFRGPQRNRPLRTRDSSIVRL